MTRVFITLLLLFCVGISSCTQSDISEGLIETQACCGDDEHNPPPPPPPPGGNG